MNTTDFVLCLMEACGGEVPGRTLLQKRAFFVRELLAGHAPVKFVAHYYGPFAPEVDSAVGQLKALGFLDESARGFGADASGFELKRYDYRLTEDGRKVASALRAHLPNEFSRILGAVQRIREAGDPGYFELSIAAKVLFILKSQGKPLGKDEVKGAAERLNWKITTDSMEKAVSFLQRLDLVTVATRDRQEAGA